MNMTQLTHEFIPMIEVSATGEVTGDYWEALFNFERREANLRAERMEREREARKTAQPEQAQPKPAPKPTKKISLDTARPSRYAPFETKLDFYGPEIMKLFRAGMKIEEIMLRVHLGRTTVNQIIQIES
jgi:hypothetical protein